MTTTSKPTEYTEHSLSLELARLFGHTGFQGKQYSVISQIMSGTDTLAVMPTGAGKSLCYQLPAMLLPGTTLVISPLIALMKDQYDSLPADVYERTTFINSSLDAEELQGRMADVIGGTYKLVYCAPERLRQQPFIDALRRCRISLFVVDEAHCVSMWGHDFRPDYLFIGKCLPQLGHPTLLALTATATPEIRREIGAQLGRKLSQVVGSVFRPNLYYSVEEMPDKEQKMKRLIELCKEERGSGVIYARSRDTCEQLAMMLKRAGVSASHYHAGLDPEARSRTQEEFMLDKVRVMVATIAFGMGVDKGNVRFIVHFSPPDSLEGYIQESGRAGRDGRDAKCFLFVSPGDKTNMTRWKRQEQIKIEELRAVYREVARQLPATSAGFVSIDEVERQVASTTGKAPGATQARVAISMLERAELIRRHTDAPRYVTAALTSEGWKSGDPQLSAFAQAAGIQPGQGSRRDTAMLSNDLKVSPDELERLLLGWSENGWVTFRGERRDAVIERLPAPKDAASLIPSILDKQDKAMLTQVEQVLNYAYADACRHRALAAHLGETIDDCEISCDWCNAPEAREQLSTAVLPDLPDNPGQAIVECLASFPFRVGKPSLVKALTGSAASNVTPERVRHFGMLAAASASGIERAIDALVEGGYLLLYESEEGYKLLDITEEGKAGVPRQAVSLQRKRQPKANRDRAKQTRVRDTRSNNARAAASHDDGPPPEPEEVDAFERLRAWRRATAHSLNLPPYVIFHDKTLWAIARARPQTEEDFLRVKGVGRSHLEKYGSAIFELLNE